MTSRALLELQVADDAVAWETAGFTVTRNATRIGQVTVRLGGLGRGITAWKIDGVSDEIDGIAAMAATDPDAEPLATVTHPNGSTLIDHVVLLTPDIGRTTAELARHDIEARRTRVVDPAQYGFPAQQVFFRLGEVILEVIGPAEPDQARVDQPARLFGLAINVRDLGTLPNLLGDRIGRIKDAVQPGRRITTLRHKDLGMSVATAFMDDRSVDGTDRATG